MSCNCWNFLSNCRVIVDQCFDKRGLNASTHASYYPRPSIWGLYRSQRVGPGQRPMVHVLQSVHNLYLYSEQNHINHTCLWG